jgi:hypothetical protein
MKTKKQRANHSVEGSLSRARLFDMLLNSAIFFSYSGTLSRPYAFR